MMGPADHAAGFTGEQDAGDSGAEGWRDDEFAYHTVIDWGCCSLRPLLIRTHWEGDTTHLWSVLW